MLSSSRRATISPPAMASMTSGDSPDSSVCMANASASGRGAANIRIAARLADGDDAGLVEGQDGVRRGFTTVCRRISLSRSDDFGALLFVDDRRPGPMPVTATASISNWNCVRDVGIEALDLNGSDKAELGREHAPGRADQPAAQRDPDQRQKQDIGIFEVIRGSQPKMIHRPKVIAQNCSASSQGREVLRDRRPALAIHHQKTSGVKPAMPIMSPTQK